MIEAIEMPPEAALEFPDCAPTKVLPKDLSNAIKGIEVQKYYASDLLDIKEDEPIYFELFQQENSSNLSSSAELVIKVMGLLIENDACDKVGIKFLAGVYNASCSKYANEFGQNLCNIINLSKAAVAKFAIIYSNANATKPTTLT